MTEFLSLRVTPSGMPARHPSAMRLMVDVRTERREWLEKQAREAHRTTREHASFLLDEKMQEEMRPKDAKQTEVAA